MDRIDAAILRTVIYADIFNFPLTVEEIHHFLIGDEPASIEAVRQSLSASDWLRHRIATNGVYYALSGRDDLFSVRDEHEAASRRLWPQAVQHGAWLSRLPFVRMVAVTGALAMRNASDQDDDLDYLLITAAGRVWLARAFAVLLVRLARLRGVEICPNYVLAETALQQDKRDLFMAHEMAQMVPLFGRGLYWQMREANTWVNEHLANASRPYFQEPELNIGRGWAVVKRLLEALLGGRAGDALEAWEYRRKMRRFAHDLQTPHSSAQLDENHVKGHFNDHGHPVLRRFQEQLEQHGLVETPMLAPGD